MLGVENRSVSISLPPLEGYPHKVEFQDLSVDQQREMDAWARERTIHFRVQDYIRVTLSFVGPDPTKNTSCCRDGIVNQFCFADERAAFEFKMRWS